MLSFASMTSNANETRRLGSATSTLLAAYLLVLQGVVVAISGFGDANARMGASGQLCLTQNEARDAKNGLPAAPAHSDRHQCCVLHYLGDGGPTPFAAAQAPVRNWRAARLSRLAGGLAARSPRAMLPVGSRAPPAVFV